MSHASTPLLRFHLLSFLLLIPFIRAHAAPADSVQLRQGLTIGQIGRAGRNPFHTDAIEKQIVLGRWSRPSAGATVTLPDQTIRTWEPAQAAADGWFTNRTLMGGYLYVPVESQHDEIKILKAVGHSLAYINGEPRAGDLYQYGYVQLPILLKAGTNDLLFAGGRGRVQAQLISPKSTLYLSENDPTLPDLIAGEHQQKLGAVLIFNASTNWAHGLALRAGVDRAGASTPVPPLPPLSLTKASFIFDAAAPRTSNQLLLQIELIRPPATSAEAEPQSHDGADTGILDFLRLPIRVRQPGQTYKQTFQSEIDGSTQYYAVNPASAPPRAGERPALFLTLHGASVEAIGQADAYSPKNWGCLVAPTNRRPYGFDWEDWGEQDALEVLELAQRTLHTDPERVYLTGHSMGGHGTWHVGVTHPDRFAAIGPSAGWISFWSYAGSQRQQNPAPLQALIQRAASSSDTLLLASNYTHHGVYILHGDADDNVPVTEARHMKDVLSQFHHDFTYHEQPGAGHWWENSDEPGAECVDWPPMFDLFAHHRIPTDDTLRQVQFVTANPGISSRSHWVEIQNQHEILGKSSVSIQFDPGKKRFIGTTENVSRLALHLDRLHPKGVREIRLDHDILPVPKSASNAPALFLSQLDGHWSLVPELPKTWKGPHRYGPFKAAFSHHMLFVYGTGGTPEENAWALAKARFDSESFWYRGNASIPIIPDHDFDPAKDRDRSVILYGNADTHSAWAALLHDSPIQVRRGKIETQNRTLTSDSLGCLFVRPRPGSDAALVGVVTGTGLPGMRLTERMPYFLAGVAYPDCLVYGPETLDQQFDGVRLAGFFGPDWKISSGQFLWSETP